MCYHVLILDFNFNGNGADMAFSIKISKAVFGVFAAGLVVGLAACDEPAKPEAKKMEAKPAAMVAKTSTLDVVKKRDVLHCGVHQGLPGFGSQDEKGNWTGIDVDTCRAVAAAVLGDATKVKFTPLSAKERFTALTSSEIDMLSRSTTWTLTRDTTLGVNFVGVNFYDGQGFLVPKALGVIEALKLGGATVCVNTGTTTELNVADFFRKNKMEYKILAFEHSDQTVAAYDGGRCDVYTTDQSGLAAQRTKLKSPDDHVVLADVISKEPLGPVVRHGDDQWFDVVKWTLYALVAAEELGITAENVDEMMTSSNNPEIKRLLGVEGKLGGALGLEANWAANAIKAVGNYGQSYERNVGLNTPLKLPRGLNALWTKGGLMYPMPAR
jgi:general L-amino acid transport system substrate-binding protein